MIKDLLQCALALLSTTALAIVPVKAVTKNKKTFRGLQPQVWAAVSNFALRSFQCSRQQRPIHLGSSTAKAKALLNLCGLSARHLTLWCGVFAQPHDELKVE